MMEDCLSDSDKGSRKIKVVDRRRFDESGDLRPDQPAPVARPAPQQAQPVGESPPATPDPGEPIAAQPPPAEATAEGTTSPLFMDLVAGLAQQAEILLTGAQGMPAQPAEAQRVIEYLAMLEDKTKGNLSGEEQQVLSSVVFQLRTLFVQHNA